MAKRTDSREQKSEEPHNGDTLRAAVSWAVQAGIFAHLPVHGNTSWQMVDLITLAMVWVWSGHATLTGAFAEARHWSLQVLGRLAVGTFQGLLKALVTWTATLLPLLQGRLQQLMQEQAAKHWRVGLWLALAVDGSRISVARTLENEKAFCAPHYGKSRTAKYRRQKSKGKVRRRKHKPQPVKPQLWITLLWHMGLQMPWSWRTGPSYACERDHLRQLVAAQKFPANTLFCADAGFTGYELWKALLDAGHSFLIRVGGNVTLLRRLGYYAKEKEGIVYCWPQKVASKKQPPLVLRLLRVRVGKCTMSLLTNVLSEHQLSDRQAMRLYKLRWGVELQFRTVKQTFGRRKLRSRSPARAYVELDWSMLGLWLVQLFAVKEQIAVGKVPQQCSVSLAIQVVRTTFQRWSEISAETFVSQLQKATKDEYRRQGSKKARYRPDYKDKPAAGHPKVLTATREQKEQLRKLNVAA